MVGLLWYNASKHNQLWILHIAFWQRAVFL